MPSPNGDRPPTELDELCERVTRRIYELLPDHRSPRRRRVVTAPRRRATRIIEQDPSVRGWNHCPVHDRVWQGLPLEVCGAHGGPFSCNERGQPVTAAVLARHHEGGR